MDLDNTTGNSQPLANNSNSNNNLTNNDPTSATTITTATTGNNNCTTMTTANVLKSNYDTDVVRLIGQHLIDMGLKQTVNLLLEETGLHGLDHPLASRFQQNILAGDWDQASSLVEELVNLVIATNQQQQQHPLASVRANVDSATISAQTAYCLSGDINRSSSCSANQLELDRARCISEMRVAIAEQKFLELIEDRQHINALKCLRLEITPLCGDDIKVVKHLANLIMCKSTEEIRLKANWPGKGLQSRQMLIEKLQRYIPPLILLPLRRLSTLLNQAKQLQEERCLLHMKQDDDCNNESDDLSLASMSSTPTCGDIGSRNNGTNIATMNNDDAMNHSNGHISSSLASASSSISANTSDNPARNEYFDLKQDHICPPDKFPLISRQELRSHRSEVWYCMFSNDGTKLATGGRGGKVKIWHVEPNEPKLVEKCTLDCNCNSITCLSWSPNDVYLISCSEDKPDLYIWDVNKEESHRMISHSDDESTTTCTWHLSGQKFAAASIKGNFNIYDLDGNRHGTREGVRVQCLQFLNKDPNYILAADTLNRIKSYAIKDMSLETEEEDILEEKNCIMSFTIDQDDKYIAVNVMEQGIHLWNFRLKTLLRTFAGVSQRSWTIYSSFSSPRATFLASGSEDGVIYIYNITNNGSVFNEGPIAKLYGHQKCVNCVTWNPKFPHLLASVSDDRCVRLWAPSEKECLASHIVSSNQTNLLNSASSVQC